MKQLLQISLALTALAGASTMALAQDVATVAARAQTAYFAGSAAELIKLSDSVGTWAKSANTREQYAYAFVQFRLLQLSVIAKRKDDASKSGDACVGTLDALLKREPKSAEGHALQSACFGYLANLGGFAAMQGPVGELPLVVELLLTHPPQSDVVERHAACVQAGDMLGQHPLALV